MDLSYLLGEEIETHDPILSATGTATRKCKYTVIEVYPYFVKGMRICENGAEIYECFSIGDLVTLGALKTKAAPNKSGYRFTGKYEGRV